MPVFAGEVVDKASKSYGSVKHRLGRAKASELRFCLPGAGHGSRILNPFGMQHMLKTFSCWAGQFPRPSARFLTLLLCRGPAEFGPHGAILLIVLCRTLHTSEQSCDKDIGKIRVYLYKTCQPLYKRIDDFLATRCMLCLQVLNCLTSCRAGELANVYG